MTLQIYYIFFEYKHNLRIYILHDQEKPHHYHEPDQTLAPMTRENKDRGCHPLSFEAHLIVNFWSSECQYACIIGRVATKVNEVNCQLSIFIINCFNPTNPPVVFPSVYRRLRHIRWVVGLKRKILKFALKRLLI